MASIFEQQKNDKGISFYVYGKKLFTLRTCIKKSIDDLKKDIDGFGSLMHATLEPKDIKPAKGILRDVQLSALKILKEIDRVCKEHKLTYWIDFGTLLGAVRHEGFIPWDDDIDICMVRDDYERFVEIFNKNTKDTKLKANLFIDKVGEVFIKVAHIDTPELLFVDIFPIDYLYKEMNDLYHETALSQGISDSAQVILYTVCELGDGCLQKDICERSFLTKQTVHSSVRKLEREGFLRLEPGKGRDMHLFLTEQGRALAEKTAVPLSRAE